MTSHPIDPRDRPERLTGRAAGLAHSKHHSAALRGPQMRVYLPVHASGAGPAAAPARSASRPCAALPSRLRCGRVLQRRPGRTRVHRPAARRAGVAPAAPRRPGRAPPPGRAGRRDARRGRRRQRRLRRARRWSRSSRPVSVAHIVSGHVDDPPRPPRSPPRRPPCRPPTTATTTPSSPWTAPRATNCSGTPPRNCAVTWPGRGRAAARSRPSLAGRDCGRGRPAAGAGRLVRR